VYEHVPVPVHVGTAYSTDVVHGTAVPHWPFEPHVSTPLPEHCVAPGEQTPVHAPPLHR
jgi:hypothetical protein